VVRPDAERTVRTGGRGDLVFVLDGIGLRAFDRRDGTERWGRRRVDSVLSTDGAVFLTAESGLEARSFDGTRRWRRETDGFYVDPAMALGRGDLFVAAGYENEANALVAHDPATGRVRWATRALDPDTLCLTGAGLVAVDATERWRVPASEFGERAVGPVVAGDHVLVTEQADDSPGDRLAVLTALACPVRPFAVVRCLHTHDTP
jgi:outer membrane protein assembly factor BamB